MLIASCSGVPKNNEQAPTELAIAESAEINKPDSIPEESSELAEAVAAEEEKPVAEYVEAFVLDEPQEIAEEPELQPTEIVMETLRPVETVSPVESALPVEPSSLSGTPSPLASVSPSEPMPPALPEQRTAQTVPPVRESWRQPPAPAASPKDDPQPGPKAAPLEMPAIVQEQPPVVNDQPEERILQPDHPITFSRVARVTVGQLVESFIFRVEASGIYALKFYRQDFIRDLILNDHVQIIVGGAPETTGLGWFNPPTDHSRVIAGPRWPNFLEPPQRIDSQAEQQLSRPVEEPAAQPPVTVQPPAAAWSPEASQPSAVTQPPVTAQPATPPARQPARNETARPQGLSGDAVAQAAPAQPPSPPQPVPEPVSPDSILKQARDEFNAGRIASAITLLDQFCKSFPSGSDEAWWLYGQCFEANSPNRNMLSALDYYKRLVREYPQSSRLNDARRRIAYLERYYINIQ